MLGNILHIVWRPSSYLTREYVDLVFPRKELKCVGADLSVATILQKLQDSNEEGEEGNSRLNQGGNGCDGVERRCILRSRLGLKRCRVASLRQLGMPSP